LLTRVRFAPVLLIATLTSIIVAGSSIRTAHAVIEVNLNSRQYDWSTENLGQMLLDGQGPYNLPYNTRVPGGTHIIRFNPPAGYYFVGWWSYQTQLMPSAVPIYELSEGSSADPTITAIYQKNGLPAYGISVGGVVVPVNKLAVLAPYLALIGLVGVVTAAVAVTRRRKP